MSTDLGYRICFNYTGRDIYPEQHLVAVRLHAVEYGNDERENRKYGFPLFRELVSALVQPRSVTGDEKFKIEVPQ